MYKANGHSLQVENSGLRSISPLEARINKVLFTALAAKAEDLHLDNIPLAKPSNEIQRDLRDKAIKWIQYNGAS